MTVIARFIVRIAGHIGIFIAAIALCIAIVYGISLVGAVLFVFSGFAKQSPELGIPIVVAFVAFCLYCAFRGEKASPRKDVLRGPIVIKTDEHTISVRRQEGAGTAPLDVDYRPSTSSDESRQSRSH